jgi:hypothetical protein
VPYLTALGLLVLALSTPSARADWEALPESRHHLYQTYANFVEQHNTVAWRGDNRYWAAVAINLPVAGDNENARHPQVVFHLSGNDSMHVNAGGGVFTETLDTRIGFFYETRVPELWDLGFSLGIQHESGHTADGTDDPDLHPLNLGDNTFRFTAVKDFDRTVRASFQVAPVINSIPEKYPTLVTATAECFPWESNEGAHRFSPFVSTSVTHRLAFNGRVTFQLQVGVATGSHFQDAHTHDLQLAVGYYSGIDPRAKYSQYDHARTSFGFLGATFDL